MLSFLVLVVIIPPLCSPKPLNSSLEHSMKVRKYLQTNSNKKAKTGDWEHGSVVKAPA